MWLGAIVNIFIIYLLNGGDIGGAIYTFCFYSFIGHITLLLANMFYFMTLTCKSCFM